MSLAVKPDDVGSGRRDLDPNARLPVVQGRMGSRMGYSEEIVSALLTGTGEFYPGGTPANSCIDGGVPPGCPNLDPISDQNM